MSVVQSTVCDLKRSDLPWRAPLIINAGKIVSVLFHSATRNQALPTIHSGAKQPFVARLLKLNHLCSALFTSLFEHFFPTLSVPETF